MDTDFRRHDGLTRNNRHSGGNRNPSGCDVDTSFRRYDGLAGLAMNPKMLNRRSERDIVVTVMEKCRLVAPLCRPGLVLGQGVPTYAPSPKGPGQKDYQDKSNGRNRNHRRQEQERKGRQAQGQRYC